MPDEATVKRALRSLAGGREEPSPDDAGGEYRETIERADAAVDDLDAAAAFVEEVGLAELERAVARAETDLSATASDGRAALSAFREFREVAHSALDREQSERA
ncbi:hypothetical protein [Halomicrobium salinisoli]|uniref:hypothetical protein n=1 Tax=Halomicrobium salinisoli TaxID=2878391 RepID=UPI001CF0073F|nr:hypothetical protein [Halomicrobium salinisoli]